MTDVQKTPEQLPETDVGLQSIRNDIAQLKKDNELLQSKQADFEKNKSTLPKEESDRLKKEIDDEILRIENKKKELLELIKQTKGELAVLQGSVETNTEKAELEALEKEIKDIQTKKQNFLEKGRGWAKENPWKAAAVVTGVGLLVGRMAGRFKKKKKTGEDGKDGEKKEGFRNHGFGRVLKYIGVGAAAIFGISRLYNKFKGETDKPPEIQADDFDKLSAAEKEKFNTFGGQVNTMYGGIYQKEIDSGLLTDFDLGNGYNNIDEKKYMGVVPFSMDKTYSNINDMLSEGAINRHIRKKNVAEYKEIIAGRAKDKLASLLGPTLMKLESFNILGYKPGEDISVKIQTWLDNNPEEACKELDIFFRHFIMVLTYLEEKKIQLRRKLTTTAVNTYGFNGKKLEGLDEEEKNDLIEDAMDNKEWMEKYVNKTLKAEFDNQKIIFIGDKLQNYGLYNEKISEDLQSEIDDLDERRNDLLDYDEDSKTDILDRAETDITDGSLEGGTKKGLSECAGEVLNDAIDENGEGFMQTYFEPFAIACGMDQAAREKFLQESGGKELIDNFGLGLQKYKEKFDAGTVTKEDVSNFKIIVNKYMAFKKEAIVAVHTMQNISEDNPDKLSRAMNVYLASMVGLYEGCTKSMPLLQRVSKLCTGLVIGGTTLYLASFIIGGKNARNVAKVMIKVGGAPAYGVLRLSLRGVKKAGGRLLFSGRYRQRKVLDAKSPLSMFEYAFMNGDITPERGVKIARKLNEGGRLSTRIDTPEELLEHFKVPKDKSPLVLKYMEDKNIRKLMITKTKKPNYGVGDRWKHDIVERKTRWIHKFSLDEVDAAGKVTKMGNLSKLKYIDDLIDESKKSGGVLKYILKNVDVKQFDKLYTMAHSTTFTADIDNLFTKMGSKLDAKKFGKLLGRNLDQFADIADMKAFFHTLETANIDAKSTAVMIRGRKEVKVRLAKGEKLDDILKQLNKNFIKKVTPVVPNVIKNLTPEQKFVEKLIADDVDELKKFITRNSGKQKGWGPNEILTIHYEKQLEKLEKFQKEIKTFSPDELSAFKNLHALEFKSHHIVELLELKKNKSIALALENMEKKTGSIDDLLRALKTEKASEEISESLIRTVEKLHINPALKSADEAMKFVKAIFKFIGKVT